MKRDQKGRFTKERDDNDGYNLSLTLPSFRSLLYWLILLIILLPWTVIFARFNICKKIFDFFENIMSKRHSPKKWFILLISQNINLKYFFLI